jgi:prepilin-type N-terminal cleavage/methylation domain-containing protein
MPATRRAVTLIELLVSIAIIGSLIGILVPVLKTARLQSLRVKCMANMRQVLGGVLMYTQDNGSWLPRIADGPRFSDEPSPPSAFATENFRAAVDRYIYMTDQPINPTDPRRSTPGDVWFDPADPDRNLPAMWGSFVMNGLLTAVPRKDSNVANPTATVYATLREKNWTDVVDVDPPLDLPVGAPEHPFWRSDYFRVALGPWADSTDAANPYHWRRARVVPPVSLCPYLADATDWDKYIDGGFNARYEHQTRYPSGNPYGFFDGHIEPMDFGATYHNPDENMWDIR